MFPNFSLTFPSIRPTTAGESALAWNWLAAATTTHVVARMNGISSPVDRSNVARPRKSRSHPRASIEYGSRNVMLIPTAVAAAVSITFCWSVTIFARQYSALDVASMKPVSVSAGRQSSEGFGTKPLSISPKSTCPFASISPTTAKKLTTTTPTIALRISSKTLMPLPPDS